jgi:cytochrome c553
MRKILVWAALAGAALGLAAAIVVAAGGIPITASSGHWRATAWMLDFTKRRSVDTHSFFIVTPPLDDPALVIKGAGHYELGCAPCHGSPLAPRPRIVMGMTPHPPFVPERIRRWLARELFYIVKHGMKFTGMPAWPSQSRDDEVWAMVAFLRALPALDGEGYRRLVWGPPGRPGGDALIARCAGCHGADGLGREEAAFPRLAGQSANYLVLALQAYARQSRHSGVMGPIAAGLGEGEVRAAASHFAGLPVSPPQAVVDQAALARGAEIATRGIPQQDVPACVKCHAPASGLRNPNYPVLAGQFGEYIELQLELFAAGRRGGSAYAEIMRPIASRLNAEQMREVALYFASARSQAP